MTKINHSNFKQILCCALAAVVITGAARDGYAGDGRHVQRNGSHNSRSSNKKQHNVLLNRPSVTDENPRDSGNERNNSDSGLSSTPPLRETTTEDRYLTQRLQRIS